MIPVDELTRLVTDCVDPAVSELAKDHLALMKGSQDPIPLYDLARLCRRRGFIDLWRASIDLAFALPHRTHEQLYRRAHARLTLGDWSGWVDRESRIFNPDEGYFQSRYVRKLRWAKRAWDGAESLADMSLLILADGGFGDCIQTLRFVPQLAAMAGQVILGVRPELVTLVEHNLGRLVSVAFRDFEHAAGFERYTWGMSLPALCGGLPPFRPLTAPAMTRITPQRDTRRQVGLCWAGSATHPRDAARSMPIGVLEPLFARDDVQWHSLQVGDRSADCAAYSCVSQPAPCLVSFADTAQVIASLDLVVTVDTSVAHLSGSLGIPTLLLLEYASEFRWGLLGTTPWYPSMRLLRQAEPGNWPSVIMDVMAALDSDYPLAVPSLAPLTS